jgi:xanthine dehydrogenase YagR molybdenum-binding subunit
VAEYSWPQADRRKLIGARVPRVDGPVKSTGVAKYTDDIRRPGMLYARILRCPHAHARIRSLDVEQAKRMPGVRALKVIQGAGSEVQWHLDEIVALAAATDAQAEDAIRAIRVEYEVLPHFVNDADVDGAPNARSAEARIQGDPDRAFAAADTVVSEGTYGCAVIAHCCLEPHGQVCEWDDDGNLTVWSSTQAVSGMPGAFAEALGIPASKIKVICHHMGGGFGSKFGPDRWGIVCAELARESRAPVRLMLEREEELAVAGDRPSTYATVKVAARRDGTLTAWQSRSWGSGGLGGSGSPPIPYVFTFDNLRHQHVSIPTNVASARAWRAPNHPQACFVTMTALEDLAAKLGVDPLDFFLKNIQATGERASTYAEQLRKGAELIGWKRKWHPRGRSGKGPIARGLGLSIHTWGGRGHVSNCEVVVQADGSVEARIASQDLGTGTRTVIAIVLAETFGLPVGAVSVKIGESVFPPSGASGGSTTVGGVSVSTRRAAVNALQAVFEKVAPSIGVTADRLEAVDGLVRVHGDPSRSLTWKQAASRIGMSPITARGETRRNDPLNSSGVGGIQMAEVSVDRDTGIVRMEKMICVQDCGLVVDLKTAESQVYGGMIMGIAYALAEEKIHDPATGRLLNGDMEFYKLPGIGDVGELIVHMQTGPGHDERGPIGLGEPPVISPGAAISNAVANALGVRVPYLPLTPDRVLAALEKGRTT